MSRDYTTALQPGWQNKTLSQKKGKESLDLRARKKKPVEGTGSLPAQFSQQQATADGAGNACHGSECQSSLFSPSPDNFFFLK